MCNPLGRGRGGGGGTNIDLSILSFCGRLSLSAHDSPICFFFPLTFPLCLYFSQDSLLTFLLSVLSLSPVSPSLILSLFLFSEPVPFFSSPPSGVIPSNAVQDHLRLLELLTNIVSMVTAKHHGTGSIRLTWFGALGWGLGGLWGWCVKQGALRGFHPGSLIGCW